MTRQVAVVGFAHAPHVRRTDGTTNGVEMLMPCFAHSVACCRVRALIAPLTATYAE